MVLFHEHSFVECYGGLYADDRQGPRTFHEIWWECPCGKVSSYASRAAKMRADKADGVHLASQRASMIKAAREATQHIAPPPARGWWQRWRRK